MNASTSPRHRRPTRLSTARTLGWFAAASLVFAAVAPAVAANSGGQSGDHGPNAGSGGTGGGSGNSAGSTAQVDKNPTCQDLYPQTLQLKIDGAPSDGLVVTDGLTITISEATSTSFDWSSDAVVTAVIVKGGQGGYIAYAGGTSGTGLTSPNNPNGEPAGISHVEFCFAAGTDPVTPPTTDSGNGGSTGDQGSTGDIAGSTTEATGGTATDTTGDQGSTGDTAGDGSTNAGSNPADASSDTGDAGSNAGDQGEQGASASGASSGIQDDFAAICHATRSDQHPYVTITPSNEGQLAGHLDDAGAIWAVGATEWGDIIPPIAGLLPDGLNWTDAGRAWLANDCNDPTPTDTTGGTTETTGGTTDTTGGTDDPTAGSTVTTGGTTTTTTGGPGGSDFTTPVTTTPQVQAVAAGGDQATASTGGVLGAISNPVTTGPRLTLPPTDTVGSTERTPTRAHSWGLVLLGLAALIVSFLLFPQRAVRQRC